jgi:hypothetical protein
MMLSVGAGFIIVTAFSLTLSAQRKTLTSGICVALRGILAATFDRSIGGAPSGVGCEDRSRELHWP